MNCRILGLGLMGALLCGACSSSDETPTNNNTLEDASIDSDTGTNDAGNVDSNNSDSGADASSDSSVDSGQDSSAVDSAQDAVQDSAQDALLNCTPIETSPGKTASGYALDGWTWERKGLVAEVTGAASLDGYLAPSIVVANSKLHLFGSKKTGIAYKIYHATSADGLSFSALNEVSGLGTDDAIANPSVVYEGGKFKMWFGSGAISYAESTDGDSFSALTKDVLMAATGTAFDALSVIYPSVINDGTDYLMVYTGFDGKGFGIGAALSADGLTWKRSTDLRLSAGASSDFDNNAVAQSSLVKVKSGMLVWYGGYDTSKTNPGPYRIGLAQSTDGKNWVKRGVSLELSASGHEAYSTRDPSVVRWNGEWLMVYSAMGDDQKYRLMEARSKNCEP